MRCLRVRGYRAFGMCHQHPARGSVSRGSFVHLSRQVRNLVRAGLRNPRSITVSVATTDGSKQRTPAELENLYMFVKEQDKLTTLVALLRRPDARQGKTIVFTLTCGMVDYLARVSPTL